MRVVVALSLTRCRSAWDASCMRAPPRARLGQVFSCSCTAHCLVELAVGSCVGSAVLRLLLLLLLPPRAFVAAAACASAKQAVTESCRVPRGSVPVARSTAAAVPAAVVATAAAAAAAG